MLKRLKLLCLSLCCCIILAPNASAQTRTCSAMTHLEHEMHHNPKRAAKLETIERQTQQFIANGQRVDGIISIPVVVHVLYSNTTQNISSAQIASQLQVLNDDFRRTNSDADNVWSQAVDSEIQFCMASVDPDGNATNGITRTSTSTSDFGTNDSMKYSSQGGKDAWPTTEYLNMWVCGIGGGILGYAQFPGGNPATDGVVMDYKYFGTIGTASAPFDLGRTATHEVGHWLNLRHIWGDGNCNADDLVTDTPGSDAANYGCAVGHTSCNSTDMVQNYMDYSDDACMNLFTAGQKVRMRALFDTGGARASLLSSNACGNAVSPTCSDGIQNGDETGVDCGGSSCDPCAVCAENSVIISITFDNYPEETAWTLSSNGSTVASGGTYANQADGSTITEELCLADGCYDFTITDAYGDGICCSYGNGSYSVSSGGNSLASGGSFSASETQNICLGGGNTATCTDNIQNGDETGVDCGGSCEPCVTCTDNIQNGNETGVDCGGSCEPCVTCTDNIQNGNETGVDCGGSCEPCVTCTDNIQNGNETGVDCGGSCEPCNTGGCTNAMLSITLDNYPEETSWAITDASGTTIASGGTYGNQPDGSTISEIACLDDGCYVFTINDAYGDGICCNYGNGGYAITIDGNVVVSGGAFGSSETSSFCVGDAEPTPTCDDGIQNGNETAIDCGGSCAPCNTGNECTYAELNANNFESGWGIWSDGGSDSYRSSFSNYANSGTYSIRLRDNTNSSVMTTSNLNLAEYDELTVDFSYVGVSMDNSNEDFWLQISTNGGSSYTTVEEWNRGDEFQNNVREDDSVVISGPFNNSTRLRFRCDASGNSDYVYIDDVVISGCSNGGARLIAPTATELANEDAKLLEEVALTGVQLFPNPASDQIVTIRYDGAENANTQILITNISGQQMYQQTHTSNSVEVKVNTWNAGLYIVYIMQGDQRVAKKLVIQ